jgi:spermidine/putrescine-binding protein
MKGSSAYISSYYAGDYLTMAADNNDLRFYYPKEGTNYFVDAFCIPTTTTERKYPLANEYINFMIDTKQAMSNALYIGYASPNKAVVESDEYKELLDYNYSIYESDEEDAECLVDAYEVLYGMTKDEIKEIYPYNPAYENYYKDENVDIQEHVNTLWESLKTENSTELWIHITSGAIVFGVLGFAIYSSYIRKKRSKFYRDRDREIKRQKQMKK